MLGVPAGTRYLLPKLLLIGAVLAVFAGGFAYAAGWLTPARLGQDAIVDSLEDNHGVVPGFRRAHAKGLCFIGSFAANGQGQALSRATAFAAGSVPVFGRFSTGVGRPDAPDGVVTFHSLALSLTTPDGQVWRMALDDTPIFPVADAAAFVALQAATTPDPATGKPDPKALGDYLAAHPETQAFLDYMRDSPIPSSFANGTYYSINAFRFTDAAGQTRFVRWRFEPEAPFAALDKATLATLPRDALFDEVIDRLAQGPLRWHLLLTPAEPGDPVDDATKAWPADRPSVEVGVLTIERAVLEDDGPCRDITFDPLILPDGIAASDDPLLAVRSGAYSVSFTRRAAEGPHPSALASDPAAKELKP